jgi:hypothetical protein
MKLSNEQTILPVQSEQDLFPDAWLYSVGIAAEASDRLEPAFLCTVELLLSSLSCLQCSHQRHRTTALT